MYGSVSDMSETKVAQLDIYRIPPAHLLKYGTLLKMFYISAPELGKNSVYETAFTYQPYSPTRALLYIVQKRPFNKGKVDSVYLGTADFHNIKELLFMQPITPVNYKRDANLNRFLGLEPTIGSKCIYSFITSYNNIGYQTTIEERLDFIHSVIIRQRPHTIQQGSRENIIRIGSGASFISSLLHKIAGMKKPYLGNPVVERYPWDAVEEEEEPIPERPRPHLYREEEVDLG